MTHLPSIECDYDATENAYRVRFETVQGGGRLVWADPEKFCPPQSYIFDRSPPSLSSLKPGETPASSRPYFEIRYDEFRPEGSRDPAHPNSGFCGLKTSFRFRWQRAEVADSIDPKAFQWQPPASTPCERLLSPLQV